MEEGSKIRNMDGRGVYADGGEVEIGGALRRRGGTCGAAVLILLLYESYPTIRNTPILSPPTDCFCSWQVS